ncbi:MAG: DNA methyltransferase [Thermoplasmatales archaeon]|nr:DNA methyltransferase [Thermoplasmatales archaeon]
MTVHFYFKIFNSIKSEHEAKDFAKLELIGLFGEVKTIHNFFDKLSKKPLNLFTSEPIRIQDIITTELPYGKIQGYYGTKEELIDITKLVKRLAYVREIFLVTESKEKPEKILKQIFPDGNIGKNVQFFEKDGNILFRFITNQYFLEKSQYISKLSRNKKEINMNVDVLFSHLFNNNYRIPASSTLSIGKRLEDYFAIREEASLYLNHYMHPYKGKFHPKMVRALLNYIYPEDKGIVLDNFAGSGTLLVEAGYLGLDSLGVEINPLSVLMSNVKCHSVKIHLDELKVEIDNYLERLDNEIKALIQSNKGQTLLVKSSIEPSKIKEESKQLLKELRKGNGFEDDEFVIQEIIIARELLKDIREKSIKEFLLLSLSGAISDISRRTKNDFERVLRGRINDLYLRIYLFCKLNEVLKIKVSNGETYCGDTRNMKKIKGFPPKDNFVDAILNSPPYSTALDYIKNDYLQLILLKLVNSMEELEKNMMGNPRINYDKKELLKLVEDEERDPLKISNLVHEYVDILLSNGRQDAGLRVYKFFIDMLLTLKEMYRVMKKGSKCAIIIGNNHFMVGNKYIEVPNGEMILEIAKKIGFKEDLVIERELQKTSVGNIREESIIILEKRL